MQSLKERQEQDDKYNPAEGRYGTHDDLGVHPERREAEADDLENLYNAESRADEDRNNISKSAKNESDGIGAHNPLNDAGGSLIDSTASKVAPTPVKPVVKILSKLKSRGGIVGSIASSIIIAICVIGFIQAPNIIINHLRESLNSIGDLADRDSVRYRRGKLHRLSDAFTKDGRKASKITAELSRNNYTFEFDQKTGKLKSLTPPGGLPITDDVLIGQHISDYVEKRHFLRSSKWKTKRMNAFYRHYKISKKSPIARSAKEIDNPDRAVNKAIAQETLDNEKKIGANVDGKDNEDPESRASREENKVLTESDGSLNDLKEDLMDGKPINELSSENQEIIKLGEGTVDDGVLGVAENLAKNQGSIGGKVFNGVKGYLSSTDLLDKICTIKNRLSATVLASRIFRSKALMKYTAVFIKASDSTRVGNVDPKLLNSLMTRVTSADSLGNYIGSSPGFNYAINKRFSKSRNDSFKSSYGVDGKLTGIPATIQSTTDKIPLLNENSCGVIQNPAFQIGATATEVAVQIVVGVFTGGTGNVASATAKEAVKKAAKEAFQSILSKQTLKGLAKTLTVELSFEGLMALTQLYVEKTLSISVTGQEKGATLGNILAGGGGTLMKQRSLRSGMVPSTKARYSQALVNHYVLLKEENRQKSFVSRVFDSKNPNSLAYQGALLFVSIPRDSESLASSITQTMSFGISPFTKVPKTTLSSLSKSYSGTSFAQAEDEVAVDTINIKGNELVTDPAGNLIPLLRSDIENIDPKENIEYLISSGDIDSTTLEPKSENFTEHIFNCVDNVDSISTIERKDQNNPQFDCLASQPITVRYKAHLAYLDMEDTLNAVFLPEDIDSDSPGSSNSANLSGLTNFNTSEPSFSKNPAVQVDGSPAGPHKASNCTGTFTPGAQSLLNIIKSKWSPPVTSIGGYSCRSIVGGSATSIHGLGRAIDVMIDSRTPEGLAKGDEIRNWLINNSSRLGVQRVIWNRYTWAANQDGWRKYNGSNPHTDHLHIEINNTASTNTNLGRQ